MMRETLSSKILSRKYQMILSTRQNQILPVSDSIFSEEREEITEDIPAPADVPAPAPASALETVEEQPYTSGSRKSMRKNLGRPASTFSDFYM